MVLGYAITVPTIREPGQNSEWERTRYRSFSEVAEAAVFAVAVGGHDEVGILTFLLHFAATVAPFSGVWRRSMICSP